MTTLTELLKPRPAPTYAEAVAALAPVFKTLLEVRKVRGVRLKNGEEYLTEGDVEVIMYTECVQSIDSRGASRWHWDDIDTVLI